MTAIDIEIKENGVRADALLAREIPGLSRSALQRLIENGNVTRGGKTVKKSEKLTEGSVLHVELPEPEPSDILPENIPLDIIYEDSELLVINKPKGMVVHPAPGHFSGTLVNALMYHCGDDLSGIGGVIRPGIVHRIDMDTSGLLVVAKNDAAHAFLSEQLSDHTLGRIYDAVAVGNIKEDEGTINAPIGRHPTDRKKMAVTDKNSKEAVTHYTVTERYNGYTRVTCRLETGRTHQIRVHMAHIGHPLLGDTVYGRKKPEKGMDSQCLHAGKIEFIHPITKTTMTFGAPLPEYFTEVLKKLR